MLPRRWLRGKGAFEANKPSRMAAARGKLEETILQ
jgi:hypothetical protein